jgi:hypothetical protein
LEPQKSTNPCAKLGCLTAGCQALAFFSEICEATSTTGSWSGKVAIIVRCPPIAATVHAVVERRQALRYSSGKIKRKV